MELDPIQMFILAAVASGIVQVVKFLAERFGFQLSRVAVTILVTVAAFVLAFLFAKPAIPVFTGDIMEFVLALAQFLSALAGVAMVLYNLLLERVLDGLGDIVRAVASRLIK